MKKPTREQVWDYFQAAHLSGDMGEFYDHFEARGWVYKGNVKMKDWKAAARNWSRNEIKWAEEERRRRAPAAYSFDVAAKGNRP